MTSSEIAAADEARLSVVIDQATKTALEQLARRRDRSVAAEIRIAVKRHVLASNLVARTGTPEMKETR